MRSAPTVVLVFLASLSTASALDAQVWSVRSRVITGPAPQAGAQFGFALAIGDINADGFDDLVVGAPRYDGVPGNTDDGRVDIYLGSASGALTHVAAFSDPGSGGLAGWSIVIANFDADPELEVAVGAIGEAEGSPTPQSGAGAVWFLGWNGATVTFTNQIWQSNLEGVVSETNDHFGHTLAAGNFNGDAYDDLVIGVPYEDVGTAQDAGLFHVVYGDETGITLLGHQTFTAESFETGATHAGDRFGWSLAVGDFDGDDYREDLAVGAPYRTVSGQVNAGQVHVVYASGAGILTVFDQLFDDADLGGSVAANEYFGYALAAGDFDQLGTFGCLGGECADDLAIAIPGQDVVYGGTVEGAGYVKRLLGSETEDGLSTSQIQGFAQFQLAPETVPEALDFFGAALAAGDFEPPEGMFLDTHPDDLVIGSPYDDLGAPDAGVLHLLRGKSAVPFDLPSAQLRRASPGFGSAPAEAEDLYGFAMAIGDLDGDGWGDLAVGIPQKDGQGAVQVMYGALFADGFEVGSRCDWSAPPCS